MGAGGEDATPMTEKEEVGLKIRALYEQIFYKHDTNKDELLSRKEFRNFFQALLSANRVKLPGAKGVARGNSIFADTSCDGKVTFEDFWENEDVRDLFTPKTYRAAFKAQRELMLRNPRISPAFTGKERFKKPKAKKTLEVSDRLTKTTAAMKARSRSSRSLSVRSKSTSSANPRSPRMSARDRLKAHPVGSARRRAGSTGRVLR